MIFFHKRKIIAWFSHFCLISFLFYYCFLYNIPNEPFYYRTNIERYTDDIIIKDIRLSENTNEDDPSDADQINFNKSSIHSSSIIIYYRTQSQIQALDTSSLKSLDYLFQGVSFDISINHWNVSNVQSMQNTFAEALFFNSPLNKWDVSNVRDMSYMFASTEAFNQPIGNWDVGNVTDMHSMFRYATQFNQPIGNWDVSRVKNMELMFFSTKKFNSPIGEWDVSNVVSMDSMFFGALSFNQDLSQWCVSQFKEKPNGFDNRTPAWEEKNKPQWGTCPRGEDKKRKQPFP